MLPTPFEDSGRATQIVNKGRIQVGYDADLVLVDMNLSKTIRNEDQLTRTPLVPLGRPKSKRLASENVGAW